MYIQIILGATVATMSPWLQIDVLHPAEAMKCHTMELGLALSVRVVSKTLLQH